MIEVIWQTISLADVEPATRAGLNFVRELPLKVKRIYAMLIAAVHFLHKFMIKLAQPEQGLLTAGSLLPMV